MSDLYQRAVEAVTIERKASTSFIQRKLQIGYNNAASLMERMEADGIISPTNHVGKRDILVGPDHQVPADAPPFDVDPAANTTSEAIAQVAEPTPAKEPYTGPTKRFSCSGCDLTAEGPANELPDGWYWQTSARLGEIPRCLECAKKNASRIATGKMSTEEILTADTANSDADAVTKAAQGRLKTIVERIDRLLDDISAVQGDLKEVRDEAKGEGFDVKILMKVVRERRKDKVKREEEEALFDLYVSAIGGL